MKTINQLAFAAKNNDQHTFGALYSHSAIQSLKSATIRKYTRKYSCLNPHDVESLFDDQLLDCVAAYPGEPDDFLAYLSESIKQRAKNRYRDEMRHKRCVVHLATTELVDDIDAMDDTTDRAFHVPIAPNNTEEEAIRNIMMRELEPQDAALARVISDGKVVSIAEAGRMTGFRNRQQAHRAIDRIRKIAA